MSSPEPDEKKFEALGRALREAEKRRRIFVPPTLDETILKAARGHFGAAEKEQIGRARFHFDWRWILASAASIIALCLFLFAQSAHRPVSVAREDINGDGRVDILDAFALAKAVEGKRANDRFDQNDDHKLDDLDVRAVALAAVRLDRKPGS
jgi:hypothetical protein